MSLNSVAIGGNLTKDPELKVTTTGKSVTGFSIANNQTYTKDGEKIQDVLFIEVSAWGKVGENVSQYLKKGDGVVVEGILKN